MPVTRAEYEGIVLNMAGVVPFGTATEHMFSGNLGGTQGCTTCTFSTGPSTNPSPANVHVFAFRVATTTPFTVTSSNQRGDFLRLSASGDGFGYNPHGNTLPTGTVEGNETFYVLKSAQRRLFPNPMYLGLSVADDNQQNMWADPQDSAGWYMHGQHPDIVAPASGRLEAAQTWAIQGLAIDPDDVF